MSGPQQDKKGRAENDGRRKAIRKLVDLGICGLVSPPVLLNALLYLRLMVCQAQAYYVVCCVTCCLIAACYYLLECWNAVIVHDASQLFGAGIINYSAVSMAILPRVQ